MATHFQRLDSAGCQSAGRQSASFKSANPQIVDHLIGRTLPGPTFDRSLAPPAPLPPSLRASLPTVAPSAPAAPENGEPQSTRPASFCCPDCDSPQTQSVPAIFDALTAKLQSHRPRGELSRRGDVLWGSFSEDETSSTRFAQLSQLARRFAPPVMDCDRLVEAGRSRVAAAGGSALAALLVVMLALVVLGNKPAASPLGPEVQQPDTSNSGRALTVIAALALFGVPILVFAKVSAAFDAKIARLRGEAWEAFDWEKRAWKSSFYCHPCDRIFNSAAETGVATDVQGERRQV
ncbi:MAG TPA: hypothetical protein VHY91_00365 [Pirellulales bacterium]|jgi:hypothetical protein|nr:hypothetical protein [Pirellulales bacterium]